MPKSIRIAAIVLMIITVNNLYSEDSFDDLFSDIELSEGEESLGGGRDRSPLSISGDHEFIYSFPYIDIERFEAPVFNNTFKINYQTDNIDIVSRWKFNIPENQIIPDENYIELTFNNTIFKTGYTLFSWGHADEQNPTDRLNSRDYTNPLDIIKMPALSVSVEQYISDFSLELVYIPVKTASLFSFNFSDKIPGILVDQDNITFKEINDIEKFVLGGRLNYYGLIDLSLSYIYNIDDFYVPKVDINPAYPPGYPLTGLVLENQRIHQIGFSGKTIIDRFGVWLELNYSMVETSKDYMEWTAGFDFNFGSENQGFVNMQSFGKWCPDYIETPDFSNISDYADPNDFYFDLLAGSLQNIESELSLGIINKISYKLMNDELEPEVVCIYITSLEDMGTVILKPAINYKPIDSLAITLGMNVVYSLGEIELYEEIHKNDDIFLSVKYSW